MKAYRTNLAEERPGPGIRQVHYRLDPPLNGHEFVVSSAETVSCSGPETYLFGADADGNITDWSELEGSYRGGLDCEQAIRNAGYEIQ